MDFTLQPNIYSTASSMPPNLLTLLEQVWINDLQENGLMGQGSIFILSGFSNFNGGVRFYNHIERHIQAGGRCQIILGGSSRQNMSSRQVVEKLLDIGCDVGIINRKAIFHAKCYGYKCDKGSSLIVSSGNFTSRGLTQNIEASLHLSFEDTKVCGFEWENMFQRIKAQKFEYYQASQKADAPFWKLLFNEEKGRVEEEESSEGYSTLLITLSHSDTARIQALPGSNQAKGTQYIWLSKDAYDFFPALNIPNKRGSKKTFQTLINIDYKNLGQLSEERVTFEAGNNYDFRLGTSKLRGTKVANKQDLMALTRLSERDYEMRIFSKDSMEYCKLLKYAINFIGHQGKQYGYIDNKTFFSSIEKK